MRFAMMLAAVVVLAAGSAVRAADVVAKLSDEVFEYDHDQPAIGYWVGNVIREKDSAVIALEILRTSDQKTEIQITGLAFGAINAPCEQINVEGGQVSFVFKIGPVAAKFVGDVSENGQRLGGKCTMPATGDKPERTVKFELGRTPRAMTMATAKAFTGSLSTPMGELNLSIILAETNGGELVGHADVPQQMLVGLPLVNISRNDAGLISATMPIPSASALIEATIDEGTGHLVGKFKQAVVVVDLDLPRDSGYVMPTQKRPQHPEPPYPYQTREVLLTTPGGINLAGTLTLPDKPGPYATAILITGSGQEDRDETLFGHKPFLVIADYLTRNGYAVLRCDDRGIGGSGGLDTVEKATTRDFADDVIAQVDFLKNDPDVDPNRIGLIGHSEGGLIAPMVAVDRPEIAFIVLLAGPGVNGQEILELQGRKMLEAGGMSVENVEAFSRQQRSVLALVARGASDDEIRAAIVAVMDEQRSVLQNAAQRDATTQPESQPSDDLREQQIHAQMKMLNSPWIKYFLVFDPRPTLARVKCPVLAMNGTLDLQVWHDQNLPEIEKAVRSAGGDVTIKRYDGLNHMFQPAKTGGVSEYGAIETTFDEKALHDIVAWLNQHVPHSATQGKSP